jgi:hypothetical protein
MLQPEAAEVTPAAPAPAKAAKTEPAPEPDAKTGERGADGKFVAKEAPDPPGVAKRIGKALQAQREAEQERDELKAQLAKSGSQPAAVEPAPPVAAAKPAATATKPDIKNFDSYEAYNEALVDFKLAEKAQTDAKAASDRKAADVAAQAGAKWNERVEEAKANPLMPDYEEVMAAAGTLPISQAMHVAILKSDRGPEIAYWLATNQDEAARIAQLEPLDAALALGEIKAGLKSPAPVKPAAKALPKPAAIVGGGHAPASVDLNDEKLPPEQFAREFRKRLKANQS